MRDYVDELGMAENQLEHDFLMSVLDGSDEAFKRKEKLRGRLQRRIRWGGREPYRTIFNLLEPAKGCHT